MSNANLITRGLGEDQSLILSGFGGTLYWLKKLISNAFIKIWMGRKAHIFPSGEKKGYIHPTDGKRH